VTITEAGPEQAGGREADRVEAPPARRPVDATGWRLNVLGPVELCYDGNPVEVIGVTHTLLVLLARGAGEEVGTATIIAAIWGSEPPEDPGNVVASQISRLRKALTFVAPDIDPTKVILTTPAGYILDVTAPNVDVAAFERLIVDGRRALTVGQPHLAVARLDAALKLWRGEPYQDVRDQAFARAEAARIEDLRLVALESRAEARLALSAPSVPDGLVEELEHLTTEHWHRERLWVQLMTALYRLGHRGEALAAHRRAQVRLADGLHAQPGAELAAAERAVLANDPALWGTPPGSVPVPEELSGPAPACVGRDQELAWLESALDLATTRRGQPRLVVGSPGIGKTRLVAELAHRAAGRGATVQYHRAGAGAMVADPDRLTLVIVDDLDLASPDDLASVTGFIRATLPYPVVTLVTCRDPVRVGELAGLPKLVMSGLDDAAVAEIVRIYAPSTAAATAVSAMTNTGGVPARIHRAASEWAFARAGRRVDRAVETAAEPRRWLGSVRDEVIAGVLDLAFVRAQARALRPTGRTVDVPYKGLARFEVSDAEIFHGRERLAAEMVARLVEAPLLAVIGEPASGKSSLLRAGLLPLLAGGVLPGSARWHAVVVTPASAHPLAERLVRARAEATAAREAEAAIATEVATEALAAPAAGTGGANGAGPAEGGAAEPVPEPRTEPADRAEVPADEPLLLVVDQFEEVFTVLDAADRAAFLATLAELEPAMHVVIAMRSDFVPRLAEHPEISRRVTTNAVLLTPMSAEELRRAVERPAAAAELSLEDGLVDAILDDARATPHELARLSCALRHLWENRADATLTLTAYRSTGGLAGAIEMFAERAFAAVPERARPAAQRFLMRMVTRQGDAVVARPTTVEDTPDADTLAALDALAGSGLVRVTDGVVELAHEALVTDWPRLAALIDEDRTEHDLRDHLLRTAATWSAGAGELYRGPRLVAALDWAERHPREVTPTQHQFLAASRRILLADEHRRRRRVTRLRKWVAVMALATVAAIAIAAVSVVQMNRSAAESRRSDSLRLGVQALAEPDLRLAALLAVAATRLDPGAVGSLRDTLLRAPDLIGVIGAQATAVAFSPDGRGVAVGAETGEVRLLEAGTLRTGVRLTHPGHGPIAGLAFTPDGRRLVSWGGSRAAGGEPASIIVWDLGTGRIDGAPFGEAAPATGGLLHDGVTLVVAQTDGGQGDRARVVAWNLEARTPSTAYELPSVTVDGIALTPDGRRVALGTEDGTLVVEPDSGDTREVARARHPSSLSPDGSTLLTTDSEDVVVWGVRSGDRRGEARRHDGDVLDTAWSSDGAVFASAGADGRIVVWEAETVRPRQTLTGLAGAVLRVRFAPDGRTLVTVGQDGSVALWDLTGTLGLESRVADAGDPRPLVTLACALAGRDLTPAEWRRYLPDRPYQHVCPT
jgi:DNA-binding SARP family transcriptional activator